TERGRVPADLDNEWHSGAASLRHHLALKIVGKHRADPERRRRFPPPRLELGGEYPGPRPPQQRRGEDAYRAETDDDDRLLQHLPGIESDLQCGLHQGKQCAQPGVDRPECNGVRGIDHEQVLMRVKREDDTPLFGPFFGVCRGLLDPTYAAVAVTKWVAEPVRECGDRGVERKLRVDLAAIGEQLGPGADTGVQRAHQELPFAWFGHFPLAQLNCMGSDKRHSLCLPPAACSHLPPSSYPAWSSSATVTGRQGSAHRIRSWTPYSSSSATSPSRSGSNRINRPGCGT